MNKIFSLKSLFLVCLATIVSAMFTIPSIADDKCTCDFDTKKYRAKCECALLCAVAVKEGKDCNIVCDGSSKSSDNNDATTTSFRNYQSAMSEIRNEVFRNRFNSFINIDFSKWAIPHLMRSAYIGSEFIDDRKKAELDDLIYYIFNEYSNQISISFIGKDKEFSKDFSRKYNRDVTLTSSHKSVMLVDSEYLIKFCFIE